MARKKKNSTGDKNKNLNKFEKYLKLIKKLKDYESKWLYFLLIAFGFIFYTLAYVFFYGYYFGGSIKNVPSVIKIIINPVPFNFKSLTVLGVIFALVVTVFVNISTKITQKVKDKSKLIILDMLILIGAVIGSQIMLTIIFIGKFELRIDYFKAWIVPVIIVGYFSLSSIEKYLDMVFGAFGAAFVTIILNLIDMIIKLSIPISWYMVIITIGWLIISIMSTYIQIKKIIIYEYVFLLIYMVWGNSVKLEIVSIKSGVIAGIIILIINITNKIYNILRVRWKKKHPPKTTSNEKKENVSKVDSLGRILLDQYKFILLTVSILFILCSTYYSTFLLGKTMSDNMNETLYDDIILNIDDHTKESNQIIVGNIISYKDNMLYISDKNRQLLKIKCDKFRTKPHEENKDN